MTYQSYSADCFRKIEIFGWNGKHYLLLPINNVSAEDEEDFEN